MTAQYQLVMHSGPTPGKIFPLEGDLISIGRENENNLVINDAEVSRKHSQLMLQGGKYIVSDLGSTNGTFVNGQRLTGQHILQPGEVISLGEQINLLFEVVTQVDPNATMISASHLAAPRPAAQPVASQPAFAGQVPSGPAPQAAAPSKISSNRLILIIVGVVLLCAICSCVAFVWWIDANALWCKFLPFLFPTGCGG